VRFKIITLIQGEKQFFQTSKRTILKFRDSNAGTKDSNICCVAATERTNGSHDHKSGTSHWRDIFDPKTQSRGEG
jgi:hypothetical protein